MAQTGAAATSEGRRYRAFVSLFRLADKEPPAGYRRALARRLATLLVEKLQNELSTPEPQALRLANEVVWTVTRERDGMWLNLVHGRRATSRRRETEEVTSSG